MSFHFPLLLLGSLLVLAGRLGVFCGGNQKFRLHANSSGFVGFLVVGYFSFAGDGFGCKHRACATAFPANPSNPALNPTCAKSRAVGLAPR